MKLLLLLLLASPALADEPTQQWFVRPHFVICSGNIIALPIGMGPPVTCEEALVYGHLDLCAANLWLTNKEAQRLSDRNNVLVAKYCNAKYKTRKKRLACFEKEK